MNIMITGHRVQKLENYDIDFIKIAIKDTLEKLAKNNYVRGFSGMASGVDLWFCDACYDLGIKWDACIPFEGQELTMSEDDREHRQMLINEAGKSHYVKNRSMVAWCEVAIVVFDGNKGGTHNVVQQLIENKKDFVWINPVSKVIWQCFKNTDTF